MTTARHAHKAGLLLLALLLPAWPLYAAPAPAPASATPAAPAKPKKELTEKVMAESQKITDMLMSEPPNTDGAIALINSLLPQILTESFDNAWLSLMKGRTYMIKLDYINSIPPLETALALSERYGFFGKKADIDILWTLAQLYTSDANSEKNSALKLTKNTKALNALRRWISIAPKANFEAYSWIAYILFTQATENREKPDLDLLKQAEAESMNALSMVPKPKDSMYQLLVTIAQAQNDPAKAAKYLEIMIQTNPKNASYWNMLLSCYFTIADAIPEAALGSLTSNQAYAKVIHTIERAQQNGFMLGPADYYNKAAIYAKTGQFEGAVDQFSANMRNGKMDAQKYSNWDLFANCYLHLNDIPKAIGVYREAQKIPAFAKDGNIDMQIGNLYYNMQEYAPALDAMLVAAQKGVSEKKAPGLYTFIAFIYLTLKEYDKATAAIDKALELNPKARDSLDIKRVITESKQEHDRMVSRGQLLAPQQQQTQPATTKPSS